MTAIGKAGKLRETRPRYQGRRTIILGSRFTISHPLEKVVSLPWRFHTEISESAQTGSFVHLELSATDRAVGILHLRLLNSLQPRISSCWLCSRRPFPLCGAFMSSAVGSVNFPPQAFFSPNTCILQPGLECWLRRNNRRLWARLSLRPSQYLLQCEATVLKLLPSRTQQWGVPRGF